MASFAPMMDKRSIAERKVFVEKANELKNGGNECYRKLLEERKKPIDQQDKALLQSLVKEAKRFYHLARLQAQAAYPFNPSSFKKESDNRDRDGASTSTAGPNSMLQKECFDLIASIYNNLAAVILTTPEGMKYGDYERAAEYCSNVLLIQNDNAKAMYRKAQAVEKMGDLSKALTFYKDADLAENHKNAAIQQNMVRLQRQIEEAGKQSQEELKQNIQRGLAKGGLSVSTDATEYTKCEKKQKKNKKERKRRSDSSSRGSSSSSSSSPGRVSSSSGRSSEEE